VTELPDRLKTYLAAEWLAPVWDRARALVEKNGLSCTGRITVDLDAQGAHALGGLLGRTILAGRSRIELAELDAALRRSAAQRGLIAVMEVLSGPLVDRTAARVAKAERAASLWAQLDAALEPTGLQGRPWIAAWIESVRRAGLLVRAGEEAPILIRQVCSVLRALQPALDRRQGAPRWELGQLASSHTKGAHGLDSQSLAAVIVLRAIAAATGRPESATANDRRELWLSVGVNPDTVSGTILTWNLRPPGNGPWASMMRLRADLGVVTHLTLQEWDLVARDEPWAQAETLIHCCENPQVLQAAAAAQVSRPLICVAGNPSVVGQLVIDSLAAGGVRLAYHGDFDAAGIEIANRLHCRGAGLWRMGRQDYLDAVGSLSPLNSLELTGSVAAAGWDAELAPTMNHERLAVHEEAVLGLLVADLSA
jgi:uncharacterized protein (TIGR02679 family)